MVVMIEIISHATLQPISSHSLNSELVLFYFSVTLFLLLNWCQLKKSHHFPNVYSPEEILYMQCTCRSFVTATPLFLEVLVYRFKLCLWATALFTTLLLYTESKGDSQIITLIRLFI